MSNIIGFGWLILWSVGFIAPFTLFGFLQILLATAITNYLLGKIISMRKLIRNRIAAKITAIGLIRTDSAVKLKTVNN